MGSPCAVEEAASVVFPAEQAQQTASGLAREEEEAVCGGGGGGSRTFPLDPKHDNDTVRSAAAMIFPFGFLGSTLMSRRKKMENVAPWESRQLG